MWSGLTPGKILKPRVYTCGTLREADPEVMLEGVKFKVHKFNVRPKPAAKNHTVIFSCFSEFGSELLGCLYCIPRFLQTQFLGHYVVAMGWKGRAFLYRHLVDEYWELDDEFQWLREYCRAFHHSSRNLRKVERAVNKIHGKVVDANAFSLMTVRDLYKDITETKKTACWTPEPSREAYESVKKFLKPNSVGVCARNRKCYGRNLTIDFYKRLLDMLCEMGYDPVWFGERSTTHDCPYSHITNFRDSPEADDLEKTLAFVSGLRFTVQFWTASTRLAGLVGTPFIIFESPDQIYGVGHEGLRLSLCTKGKKKLVISHFHSIHSDNESGLNLVRKAIYDIRVGNFDPVIGLVESPDVIKKLRDDNAGKLI